MKELPDNLLNPGCPVKPLLEYSITGWTSVLAAECIPPPIAETTAGQLDLLGQFFEEAIEITANVCRTVFEINVICRYCLSSTQHLDNYAAHVDLGRS